jgi:large subunit ribosomal protein L33
MLLEQSRIKGRTGNGVLAGEGRRWQRSPQNLTPVGPPLCSSQPRTSDEGRTAMAKPSTVLIKMVSSAGTGTFYTTRKNSRKTTDKMTLRKYDPKIRKHVEFKEAKIK